MKAAQAVLGRLVFTLVYSTIGERSVLGSSLSAGLSPSPRTQTTNPWLLLQVDLHDQIGVPIGGQPSRPLNRPQRLQRWLLQILGIAAIYKRTVHLFTLWAAVRGSAIALVAQRCLLAVFGRWISAISSRKLRPRHLAAWHASGQVLPAMGGRSSLCRGAGQPTKEASRATRKTRTVRQTQHRCLWLV